MTGWDGGWTDYMNGVVSVASFDDGRLYDGDTFTAVFGGYNGLPEYEVAGTIDTIDVDSIDADGDIPMRTYAQGCGTLADGRRFTLSSGGEGTAYTSRIEPFTEFRPGGPKITSETTEYFSAVNPVKKVV